jgi:O-antigen/teichoic acid export membrane protein
MALTEPHGAAGVAIGATLAHGAFFNAVAFLASTLRGIFILLVARLLGSAILGTFVLAWSVTDLVSKFATLGLDISTMAFVARSEAKGDRAASRRIMNASLMIALGAGVLLAGLGFWCTWTLGPRLGREPELVRATAVTLLALPGIALYRVANALSRGMTVMHHDIYSRGLTESLGTAAALVVAMAFGLRQLAPEVAAIAGTLASGCVAVAFARRLYVPLPGTATKRAAPGLVRTLLRASAPIALYDLINIGVMQVDVIMLGLYVGHVRGLSLETLGIYAAGVEVATGLRKISQIFSPIFAPVVARQIAAGDMRRAEESYGYLARWMLAVLLPFVAVLALSGGVVMTIFGEAFRRGAPWMAIVGLACALNAFALLGETILMVERPGLNLVNSAVAFGAVIGVTLLLIPAFGPMGAAVGMVVPYAIQTVLRGVQISWLFNWSWPWHAMIKPWVAALAALPLALFVRLSAQGSAGELASGLVYLIGYLIAWWVIGLDPNDRAVLAHFRIGRAKVANSPI